MPGQLRIKASCSDQMGSHRGAPRRPTMVPWLGQVYLLANRSEALSWLWTVRNASFAALVSLSRTSTLSRKFKFFTECYLCVASVLSSFLFHSCQYSKINAPFFLFHFLPYQHLSHFVRFFSSGFLTPMRSALNIKLLSILHICNAASTEYDPFWDNLIR